MGRYQTKSEGGQGGKKGHSNMEHWDYTEVIKASAKKERRKNDTEEINDQLKDAEHSKDSSTK